MLNGLAKLKDGSGKMAIIQNASSLFSGDAGSGPSEIRKYMIENDWLDAIVQLPADSFYNTGIATYIWIIDKGNQLEILERYCSLMQELAVCQEENLLAVKE